MSLEKSLLLSLPLKSLEKKEQLNRVIIKLIDKCNQYGGYFNRTLFGEKVVCCLSVLECRKVMKTICPGLLILPWISKSLKQNIRIGLNSGIAFSGFVGSKLICEYTAYGDVVNLAVRLMTKAEWGKNLDYRKERAK